jgi:heme-degrading monooxygenase HmoA
MLKQSSYSKNEEILMIARTWHGMTEASRADEYLDYLNQTGVPEYRTTQGNLGVYVLRRIEGNKAHFLLLTLWESEDCHKKGCRLKYGKSQVLPGR